jgi:hypothetical protein
VDCVVFGVHERSAARSTPEKTRAFSDFIGMQYDVFGYKETFIPNNGKNLVFS